jgi:hypothetical protein
MPEIHVVPKGRSNVWLWIVAVLLVVGLLAWLLGRSSGTRSTMRSRPSGAYVAQTVARNGEIAHQVVRDRRITII